MSYHKTNDPNEIVIGPLGLSLLVVPQTHEGKVAMYEYHAPAGTLFDLPKGLLQSGEQPHAAAQRIATKALGIKPQQITLHGYSTIDGRTHSVWVAQLTLNEWEAVQQQSTQVWRAKTDKEWLLIEVGKVRTSYYDILN